MVKSHYLRENKSVWSPRHVAFLDTETTPVREGKRENHVLRLWVYGCVDRRPRRPGGDGVVASSGALPEELASAVDESMARKPNLWIFAHNLGFDLATTRLIDHLRPKGWELAELSFTGRNVRAQLSRGKKTIWLMDSWSWLTTSLDHVGRAVGRPKLPMPSWNASQDEWEEYCTNDVMVLAEGMLTVLDWWDRNALGHWGRSGPSTGWAAMRHMSAPNNVVVQTGGEGREHDRAAVRGGRRDCTRVGVIDGGPFAVLDFENAHLTVAANCRLPRNRLEWRDTWTPDHPAWWHHQYGLIAECEVETDVPRYPLRTDRGIFYPVGRFRTTLAEPEIRWAAENRDLRGVFGGHRHQMGLPLAKWGNWALGQVDLGNKQVPPVVKILVKQWGRSVPGKFAGRTSRVVDWGPALYPDWHVERATYGADHLTAYDVHAGGRHWLTIGDQESDNAYPGVLAYVESYVRVSLGHMLEALGEDLWITCDTDGAVVDISRAEQWLKERTGRLPGTSDPLKLAERLCRHLAPLTLPLVPRVKMIADTLTVAGPQHFAADGFVKASGRPTVDVDPVTGEHRHMVWPGFSWQLEHGSRDGYVRVEHDWTDPQVTVHRWVTEDGRAVPVEARINPDGLSMISPLNESTAPGYRSKISTEQAPALRNLY